MNILNISFFHFLGLLLLFGLHTTCGEYNIMKTVPSFLYHKFIKVEEEIFPRDIRIQLSLTEISGTLLYSIDKNMNQLIVSLHYTVEATLAVEFRKSKIYISFPDLCGCKSCRYEMLELFIEVQVTLNIQCNNRAPVKIQYNAEKELNLRYPIPYSKDKVTPGSSNEAQLWLVNTPSYGDLYHNQLQMLGCIFEVKYKSIPIKFTSITDKILLKCAKKCVDDICNGGTCHETYNGRAVCNCTHTFKNGPNCNETLSQMNLRSNDLSFEFSLLKVSWKSKSRKIFTLSNKNLQMELSSLEKTLIFEIIYLMDSLSIQNSLTIRDYVPDKKSILILTLSEKNIEIKFFNNGMWRMRNLGSRTDLRREIFTDLTLRSEEGIIGLAYKSLSKYHKWSNVEIEKYENIKNEFSQGKKSLLTKIISYKFHTTQQSMYSTKVINKKEERENSNVGLILTIVGLVLVVILAKDLVKYLVGLLRTRLTESPNQRSNLYYLRKNKKGKVKNKRQRLIKQNPFEAKNLFKTFEAKENTKEERKKLIFELKELEGVYDFTEEDYDLSSFLKEFMKFGCLIQQKEELYVILQNKDKFRFSSSDNSLIDQYLRVNPGQDHKETVAV